MIRPVTMFVTGGESLLQLGESPNNVVSKLVSLTVGWAKAGIGIIQIREPWMSDRGLFELVSIVVDSLAVFDTKVVVNDRLDIAVAAKADGVHLKDEEIYLQDFFQLHFDRLHRLFRLLHVYSVSEQLPLPHNP